MEGPEQLQGSKVTVIGEELAYNKAMQPFRLLIIDQPLDQSHQVHMFSRCVESGAWHCSPCTQHLAGGVAALAQHKQELYKTRRSFEEHRQLLFSFRNHAKVKLTSVTALASLVTCPSLA